MSEITREVDGVTVTRHYEGNWSVDRLGDLPVVGMHALQVAPMLARRFGVPLAEARQATIEIMHEARRSPARVPAGV
ncbi:MAG TPA: hypothetical protein VGL32_02055 [Acidimicrobiales bacterium]|jgi:hypothetical protein